MGKATASRIAVVTGGTSGIGLEITKMLLGRRIPVVVIAKTGNGAAELAQMLSTTTTPWAFFQANVEVWEEQEAAFKQAITWAEAQDGTIFYAFANAGIGERKWIDLPKENLGLAEGFQKPNFQALDVNIKGTLNTVSLAMQLMRQRAYKDKDIPKIVITASICGFYTLAGLPAYTAAKHALIGFTRSYSQQMLVDHNIALYALCPNVVETHISTESFYSKIKERDPKLLTPIASVVESAERIISGTEAPGAILEQGPNGILSRTNKEFVQFWDGETNQVCDILEDRGLLLYKSGILDSKL